MPTAMPVRASARSPGVVSGRAALEGGLDQQHGTAGAGPGRRRDTSRAARDRRLDGVGDGGIGGQVEADRAGVRRGGRDEGGRVVRGSLGGRADAVPRLLGDREPALALEGRAHGRGHAGRPRDGVERRVREGGLRELREVVDGAGGREHADDAAHVGARRGQLRADRADGLVGGARPLGGRLVVGRALDDGERADREQCEHAEDDQRAPVRPPAAAGTRLRSMHLLVRQRRQHLAIHVPRIGGTRCDP